MEIKTIRITDKATADKVKKFFTEKERTFKKMSEGKAYIKSSPTKSC